MRHVTLISLFLIIVVISSYSYFNYISPNFIFNENIETYKQLYISCLQSEINSEYYSSNIELSRNAILNLEKSLQVESISCVEASYIHDLMINNGVNINKIMEVESLAQLENGNVLIFSIENNE
jgi:hypothetical protein